MINMGDVKVSVVVPVYNAEKTVGACIESVLNQTHKNIEVILVNDGSVDNSGAVCEGYLTDDRVKVFHQQNQGVSEARNLGIEKSTGVYLCFVDSDDTVSENMVEVLLSGVLENDAGMSIGGFKMCYTDYSEISNEEASVFVLDGMGFDEFSELSEKWIMTPMTCKLFFTNIIKQNGMKLEKGLVCGEDHLFVFQYLKYCSKIVFIEDCLYNYNCFNSPGGRFFPLSGQIKIFEAKRECVEAHCGNGSVLEQYSSAYALHNLKVRVFYHIRKKLDDIAELQEAYNWYWQYIGGYISNPAMFLDDDYKWFLDNKKMLHKGNMGSVLSKTDSDLKTRKKRKKQKDNLKELLHMPLKEKIAWLLGK